jgi:hypothetical protein
MELYAIDPGDFLNDPLLFGFNIVKQIFSFLHVFDFRGPSGRQKDPNFLPHHFFRK